MIDLAIRRERGHALVVLRGSNVSRKVVHGIRRTEIQTPAVNAPPRRRRRGNGSAPHSINITFRQWSPSEPPAQGQRTPENPTHVRRCPSPTSQEQVYPRMLVLRSFTLAPLALRPFAAAFSGLSASARPSRADDAAPRRPPARPRAADVASTGVALSSATRGADVAYRKAAVSKRERSSSLTFLPRDLQLRRIADRGASATVSDIGRLFTIMVRHGRAGWRRPSACCCESRKLCCVIAGFRRIAAIPRRYRCGRMSMLLLLLGPCCCCCWCCRCCIVVAVVVVLCR